MRVPSIAAPPLPAKRAHADEVLRDLHAADTTPAGLGMRRPAATQPKPSQHALAMASSATLRTIVGVYDVVAAEVEALLTELAELAPFAAKTAARIPDCACGAPRFDAARPSCSDCEERAYTEWWNAQCAAQNTELAPFADAAKAGASL